LCFVGGGHLRERDAWLALLQLFMSGSNMELVTWQPDVFVFPQSDQVSANILSTNFTTAASKTLNFVITL